MSGARHRVTLGLATALLALAAVGAPGAVANTPAETVAPLPTTSGQAETQSEPAPTAQSVEAPTAAPAQDDVSGGNEYQEEAPPTGTGEPQEPAPADPDPGVAPSAPSSPAPSTSTEPQATTADDAQSGAPTLARTGSDAWIVAILGLFLCGLGVALRRVAAVSRVN